MTKTITRSRAAPEPKFTPAPYRYVKPDVSHLPLLDKDSFDSVLMRTLATACSYKRDYGTRTEASFVAWLVNRLPVTHIDGAGNVHVDLRTTNTHRTMFTCHTDTVHSGGGLNAVRVDGRFWRADGAPLGADDGAGVALLCHMIDAGVPGYYMFFRGEECGGIGSKWLAANMPATFAAIDRAVAFDRADYFDVITHQAGGRCCSDEFANALCSALGTGDDWFIPSDGGIYTDTAELIDLVPECTNVSVGYKNQHGKREEQDIEFLQRLAALAVAVAWDELPTKRDPKVPDTDDYWSRQYGKYSSGGATNKLGFSTKPKSGYKPTDDGWSGTAFTDWKDQRDAYNYHGYDDEHADIEDMGDSYTPSAPDNALECELFDALERAIHDDDYSDLLTMIAMHSYPEDPDWVRSKLSKARLIDLVSDAYDDLACGGHALDVLDDLYAEARQ